MELADVGVRCHGRARGLMTEILKLAQLLQGDSGLVMSFWAGSVLNDRTALAGRCVGRLKFILAIVLS